MGNKKERKEFSEFGSCWATTQFELSKPHRSQSIKIQSTFSPKQTKSWPNPDLLLPGEQEQTHRQAQMDERPQLPDFETSCTQTPLFLKSSVLLCQTLVFLSCVFGWFVFWLKRKRRHRGSELRPAAPWRSAPPLGLKSEPAHLPSPQLICLQRRAEAERNEPGFTSIQFAN